MRLLGAQFSNGSQLHFFHKEPACISSYTLLIKSFIQQLNVDTSSKIKTIDTGLL